MARRVVSVLRGQSAAARASDQALEANAYAVAEDVHLTLVLRGASVELAVARASAVSGELAGVPLPPVAASQDLRGLVESGVDVYADARSIEASGLAPADLVDGVQPLDAEALASLLRDADAVIAW